MVNFTAALDSVLNQNLESATVFKGTSRTVQNELLDSMFTTLQCTIQKEIEQADFVAVIVDDTTDVSTHLQNFVGILCLERLLRGSGLSVTYHKVLRTGALYSI